MPRGIVRRAINLRKKRRCVTEVYEAPRNEASKVTELGF